MTGNLCKAHIPIEHNDGKPPWCEECGLSSGYQKPVSLLDTKENDMPVVRRYIVQEEREVTVHAENPDQAMSKAREILNTNNDPRIEIGNVWIRKEN